MNQHKLYLLQKFSNTTVAAVTGGVERGCCLPTTINQNNKYSQYKKKRFLGQGVYGQVYLMEKDGDQIVRKRSSDESLNFDYIREVSCLLALKGKDHIIEILGFESKGSQITHDHHPIIYLEHAGKGDLMSFIQKQDNKWKNSLEMRDMLYQIVRGMAIINRMNIWHRDLKPQNILVTKDNKIKIADFGLSRAGPFKWTQTDDAAYTLPYRAPEILLAEYDERLWHQYDGQKTDIYSIGVVFINMLAKGYEDNLLARPYASDEEGQLNKITLLFGKNKYNLNEEQLKITKNLFMYMNDVVDTKQEINDQIGPLPDEAMDLLIGMVNPDPEKRMTYKEILEHPYFKDVKDKYEPLKEQDLTEFQLGTCPSKIPKGSPVNERHFVVIADWLLDVWYQFSKREKLQKQTYILALHIIRCFLVRRLVEITKLQLVGATAFSIACKYYEKYPPEEQDYVRISANVFSGDLLRAMELIFFNNIGGLLHLPTSYYFILKEIHNNYPNMSEETFDKEIWNILTVLEISPLSWEMYPRDIALLTMEIWKTRDIKDNEKKTKFKQFLQNNTKYKPVKEFLDERRLNIIQKKEKKEEKKEETKEEKKEDIKEDDSDNKPLGQKQKEITKYSEDNTDTDIDIDIDDSEDEPL